MLTSTATQIGLSSATLVNGTVNDDAAVAALDCISPLLLPNAVEADERCSFWQSETSLLAITPCISGARVVATAILMQ